MLKLPHEKFTFRSFVGFKWNHRYVEKTLRVASSFSLSEHHFEVVLR